MTHLLTQAFTEASKLPEPEQNTLGRWLLDELASEKRWRRLFAESQDLLGQLADEALAEFEQGRTEILEPDTIKQTTELFTDKSGGFLNPEDSKFQYLSEDEI